MTRRSKTRAAAEAKPAPKSAKSPHTTPRRGVKAAAAEPASGSAEKVASSSRPKTAKAAAETPKIAKPARKPAATKAGPKKVDAAPRRAKAPAPAKSSTRKAKPQKANGAATNGAQTGAKAGAAKAAAARTAKPKSGKAAVTKPTKRAAKTPKAPTRRKPPQGPAYLAAELGQPVDREGEPIGAGSALLNSDEALQEYALRLWRQMQSGGVVNRYMRAIERAGLTVDEVWTAGVIETRSTSSTADEMRRYKQKLLFRANLLEAILTETVADLHRLDGIVPSDAPSEPSPPQAAAGST